MSLRMSKARREARMNGSVELDERGWLLPGRFGETGGFYKKLLIGEIFIGPDDSIESQKKLPEIRYKEEGKARNNKRSTERRSMQIRQTYFSNSR